MEQFQLGDITVNVVQKDIKNLHLSVYPPTGRVKIAAPLRMDLETIRIYAISKLNWIKRQQQKLRSQAREAPRDYLSKEGHYYLGKRYLLKVIEADAPPTIELKHSRIDLYVRPNTNTAKRKVLVDEWYRERLKELIPALIAKWEKETNVSVNEFAIKKMKTKWGTCTTEKKRIWLNLELAKKPMACIEYIVVHEMVHLLERRHNDVFVSYMDKFLSKWRFYKEELNKSPLRHENWSY
jgi:predicted metal-dependent hydrolase